MGRKAKGSYSVRQKEQEREAPSGDEKLAERWWSVLVATLIAALGPVSFGYAMGYSSAAVTQLGRPNDDLFLDEEAITWFGSLLNIGAMLGGPIGGRLIDIFGRKLSLMFTSMPFAAGWVLIGVGTNEAMLHAGRFLSGLGVGMASLNVPVYISETASPKLRGAMGSINQLGITVGILLAYCIGDAFSWRQSSLAGAGPAALLFVLMLFMPETARWLLSHQKETKARQNLQWLRGPRWDIDGEISEIQDSLVNQEKISLREFTKARLLRPLLIGFALMFFQQFTGINAFMFYCATIFEKAGFEEGSTSISILIGVIQFLATIVSIVLVDRGGRRFLLGVSGLGMGLSCLTMGAYFMIDDPAGELSWLAVSSVSVYIVGFSFGWGPCVWLLMSEIFPVKARGTASGLCVLVNWSCSFVVTKMFSSMISLLTEVGTFWFFGCVAFLSMSFVYFIIPETKGKTLEEIEAYFQGKNSDGPIPIRETDV